MGSIFEMSSQKHLDGARDQLTLAGIQSTRSRATPAAGSRPYLLVQHSDQQRAEVEHIIRHADPSAARR